MAQWPRKNTGGRECANLHRVVPGRGQGDRQGLEKVMRFGTYYIWGRRNINLESELCRLAHGKVDSGVM